MTQPPSSAGPDVARVAKLFADGTRARMLMALAGGRRLAASALADEAGVTRQAASAQLTTLTAAGMITVEQSGRHRHYQLSSRRVAELLESLAAVAPGIPAPSSFRAHSRAEAMRRGRVCYDHIAGRLGVAITDALVERDALAPVPGASVPPEQGCDHPYRLGGAAIAVLTDLGVPEEQLADQQRRPLLRFCLDWSEHRHHLAGRLGAELLTAFTRADWITRTPSARAIRLTTLGRRELGYRLELTGAC